MVQKLHICEKVYFDQLLDFPVLLLLFFHTLLLCHILLFECWSFSIQSISKQQKSPLADKELNTKQLVDTIFWPKPWLKLISCGSNFFYLAKVLATTNSEPVSALDGLP